LLPFIKDGLGRGDRIYHIVDPALVQDHLGRLAAAGIDVDTTRSTGQFGLENWNETYLREGRFDKDSMLSLIQSVLHDGTELGFPLTRLMGHVEWALGDRASVEELLEYETWLNYVLPQYKDPVICIYDLNRFNGGILIDVLRTHPVVIIGGVLQANPFFVPPDDFLRELQARGVIGRSPTVGSGAGR
jgi:hypothetical protein